MIITLCIVIGFKHTITNKIAGFGAHVQVVNFDNNNTYEYLPIEVPDSLLDVLRALPHVTNAEPFVTKPAILKTAKSFQGVVLKGTESWTYFEHNLVRGTLPQSAEQVLISNDISRMMQIDCDDVVYCYFVGEQLRVRKMVVSGVYATGLAEWDLLFIIGLPKVVRQLNNWSPTQASGIEIAADKLSNIELVADEVYFATANRLDNEGNAYYTQTMEQLNPQIFSWLDLLDMNVVIIILLMLAVSGFNIISGLIILILDSIQMIGTLKALGADNRFVRRIFIWQSAWLIGRGLLWGNIVGLALVAIQYFTHLMPLEAATYYVNYVPVAFPWVALIALNIGTLLVSLLVLLAPSAIVTHISPAKVMHFE
ncbi:MAG: ABC transporter permease [Paludibacteraceae bacterium]|nr:ABC transporter permease [Paludibacteraceae bacterium]